MKAFKLKSIFYSLLAAAALLLSIVSCNKDDVAENTDLEEVNGISEDYVNSVANDEVFINFTSLRNQMENIIIEVTSKNNISAEEFRKLYDTKNGEALEKLFVNTDLLAVSKKYEKARVAFNTKYPTLYNDLTESIPDNASDLENLDTPKSFEFLDGDIGAKGCSKKRFVAKIACYAACGAVGCGWNPVACAVARVACKQLCKRIC